MAFFFFHFFFPRVKYSFGIYLAGDRNVYPGTGFGTWQGEGRGGGKSLIWMYKVNNSVGFLPKLNNLVGTW